MKFLMGERQNITQKGVVRAIDGRSSPLENDSNAAKSKSLGGSQAPPSFWRVPGLPRKFPELPRKFPATSPEVLSLWNLTAIQRFPGSFPDFPGSSPDFPGSFPNFPGGQPLSLGSLTPSPDSQKLSLNFGAG